MVTPVSDCSSSKISAAVGCKALLSYGAGRYTSSADFPQGSSALQEKFRLFAVRVSQLQLLLVVEIARVVEVKRTVRTFLLASAAFDTDAIHHPRCLRLYGAHRTDFHTDAAAIAFVSVKLRFNFQDVDVIALAVTRLIVRPDGIATIYMHRACRFKDSFQDCEKRKKSRKADIVRSSEATGLTEKEIKKLDEH